MCSTRTRSFVIVAAILIASMAPAADGTLLIDFKPEPSNDLPELTFAAVVPPAPSVPRLIAGPGAKGKSDGHLPSNQQTPGGLTVETPFTVPGSISGKTANVGGSTTFRDVTLALGGLTVNRTSGSPTTTTLGLSAGSFQLVASYRPDAADPILFVLLEGTIDAAEIVLLKGGTVGALLSGDVTYTGGVILGAARASFGGNPATLPGQLAFSLSDVELFLPFGVAEPATFSANATGQFAVVPEPAAALVTCAPALLLLRRR